MYNQTVIKGTLPNKEPKFNSNTKGAIDNLLNNTFINDYIDPTGLFNQLKNIL